MSYQDELRQQLHDFKENPASASGYSYIKVEDRSGKRYLVGPYANELIAEEKRTSIDAGGNKTDIVEFPTRNLSSATRMMKEQDINRIGFERSQERVSHT